MVAYFAIVLLTHNNQLVYRFDSDTDRRDGPGQGTETYW